MEPRSPQDPARAWLPWPKPFSSPPRGQAWRGRAARVCHRLTHPAATLRALFAATVPLPVRLALLQRRGPAPYSCGLGASWETALAQLEVLPPARPLALLVGADGGAPAPHLAALEQRGWQPVLVPQPPIHPALTSSAYPSLPLLSPAAEGGLLASLAPLAASPHPLGAVVAASPPAWPEALRLAHTLRWPALGYSDDDGELASALARLFPPLAVVMVAYRHPALTRLALSSVLRWTAWPPLEVVVVDNASRDGTLEACQELARLDRRVTVIANRENLGFPRAVNQGVAAGRGELLAILNNDVVVTPGWWEALGAELLNHPEVGAVGPSTNAAGNEARVRAGYATLEQLHAFAWGCAAAGRRWLEVSQLGFFCVALRRPLWEEMGGLDEGFGLGYFEDADFCRRVRRRGWRLRCLRHCFVHHEQSAAFATLPAAQVTALYENNRTRFRRPQVRRRGG